MIKIIIDSNIYDLLEADPETLQLVRAAAQGELVSMLIPRQVAEELRQRPAGFPDLFPMVPIGHAVARAGVMRAGDFLGSGDAFDAHKGNSTKEADAFIVDVAVAAADWFVSEDNRSLHRFPESACCIPMRYATFRERLQSLIDQTRRSEPLNQPIG